MSDHSEGVHLLCHSCTAIIKKHKAMLRELAERNVIRCLVCNGKGLTKGWDGTKDVCQTCAGVGVHPKEQPLMTEPEGAPMTQREKIQRGIETELEDEPDVRPYIPSEKSRAEDIKNRGQIQRVTHMPVKRRGRPPKKK